MLRIILFVGLAGLLTGIGYASWKAPDSYATVVGYVESATLFISKSGTNYTNVSVELGDGTKVKVSVFGATSYRSGDRVMVQRRTGGFPGATQYKLIAK